MPTAQSIARRVLGLTSAQAPAPSRAGTNDIVTPFPSDRSHFYAATFANLFDLDWIPVNRETGMDLGVLAKGRHLICETIGNFGFISMTGNVQSPVQPITARQPEIGRARSTSMIWWCDAMYWYGRVWLIARDWDQSNGLPTRFQWVPEWYAEVDSAGLLVEAFGKSVQQVNVYRIDGPHEGILNYGKKTIRRVLAVTQAAGNASDNPVPSIDLHQTGGTALTETEIDALIARWVTARQKKGGGVAFTNQSVEARALGIQPEQLLIAAQNYSDMQLVRLAGLPAWAVDITVEGSNLTYSNSPSRARELVDFSLQPYMTAIADRFSMDDISPEGDWYRFDTVQVLRGDLLSRMQAYQIAIATGVYSVEQCQQLEAGVTLEGA